MKIRGVTKFVIVQRKPTRRGLKREVVEEFVSIDAARARLYKMACNAGKSLRRYTGEMLMGQYVSYTVEAQHKSRFV